MFVRIFYIKLFTFTPESQSLKMILNRMKEEKFTFIKTDKKIVKLHFDSIAVIKGLGNYVQIITIENINHTYYKSLKDLIDVLPNEFMRVHNSFIVNLTNIDSIEDNHIIAKGNKITIGKTYKDCLTKAINKFVL
ncbi:LytTr DNA-binding domain-containing protein [Flavobacterium saccharophilum]|uniref:LytTr DNA-binding domain-containing protein n=2 Tax=Flavobacterium saccharophilum TaxID=29534 RepID=A0A1M7LJV8_9FLAO|nr:LytTr DNA-binding domain-containing protein [Flavobacterium saccharophilum]